MLQNIFAITILLFIVNGCSWNLKRSNQETANVAETQSQTQEQAPVSAPAPQTTPEQNASPTSQHHHSPSASSAAHHEEKIGVDPEKAFGWLKNGNTRFRKQSLRKDGQSKSDIQRLASGQSPHSIILSCSDSRVPPEVIFDQKLGEIFVVRNAGEIPDQASVASIEYALEHLGARLILVLGHTACGAVKAAIATLDGRDAGSPALNSLVKDIHPRIASLRGTPKSADVHSESWANANGIAQDLLNRSEIIRSKVESGKVKIKAALYNISNGAVEFEAH